MSGSFISLEGIEGAGKSSVVTYLAEELRARGIPLITTREPGGTDIAEQIRQIILAHQTETLLPSAELLLFFAARAQHVEHLIKPALARREWVLSDRFTDASFAYQGAGRGLPNEWIRLLEKMILNDFKPDLILLLDLPIDSVRERLALRGGQGDRMDLESLDFFARTREAYLARAASDPERYVIIDASAPLTEVRARCLAAINAHCPWPRTAP